MLIPGLIHLILFAYLPMFGIIIAFKKINFGLGILKSPWVGLANFKFLFNTSDAWIITRNTVLYNVLFIALGLVLHVFVAIGLNELKYKIVSKTCQTLMIMPHFLSMVVISYIAFAFFSNETGFLNRKILPMFDIEPIDWYVTSGPWPYILSIVHFWQGLGYGSIVYLASIAGIDRNLYEAAEIDGANKWKQIINITIPCLKPVIIIMLILAVGKIFNADFGLFYQVPQNSGALYSTTSVINTYVFNMMKSGSANSLGMSSAAAFYQSIVGFILVVIANAVVHKIDPERAMF
ncbi:sugar ABC transporter permease [Oscillospiraceae bacterium DSM 107454]|uniref:Sugar ABC transporter permease n=2 Tax=Ructibacterium gallinarum TaxID=2779355 RepID=A0A9D5M2Z8_9FIRM|nr:sugar ABC transporter permease [Ructibacterium gallinarum]